MQPELFPDKSLTSSTFCVNSLGTVRGSEWYRPSRIFTVCSWLLLWTSVVCGSRNAAGVVPEWVREPPAGAFIDASQPNEQRMDKIDQLSASQRAELEDRVKSEMLRQAFQDLVQRVTEKCFEKCVTKPSSSLTSGEQTCLAKCVDRYIEAMGVVSKAMVERQQRSG